MYNKIRNCQARMIILLENSRLSYSTLERIDAVLDLFHKLEGMMAKL